MKPTTVLFFVFSILCVSCSHKYGIVKSKAFVREQVAGTIQTDDNGRPKSSGVSKVHLIYVETATDKEAPAFSTAWVDGKAYEVRPVEVKQDSLQIGTAKDDDEPVIIHATEGNTLWQLVLLPKTDVVPDSTIVKVIQNNPVVLTGKWNGESFRYKIKKVERLSPAFGK